MADSALTGSYDLAPYPVPNLNTEQEDLGVSAKVLSVGVLFLGLAACGAKDTGTPGPAAADPHDVQVIASGEATCLATTRDQNRIGAHRTNSVRSRVGFASVEPNDILAMVAAGHACDMAKRGRMTHVGSKTSGPGARVKVLGYKPALTAENIAAGPFDLQRVLHEWNRSPGHLENILIPNIRDYGIGQAIGADGKTRFWAAVYAAPR